METTANILDLAVKLRDDLLAKNADKVWIAKKKMLGTIIKLATYQLNYEGMKLTNSNMHVKFFEGGTPMTEDAIKTLKDAVAINKQMGKQLRELRLAKK